ncbi:MAG: ABC transporter permease [Lachnospiraceae bacterium]|nr:ABC transporter permease [Lachnospiraceae bacterium]
MNCLKRAVLYISRKKPKTFLLLLLFFVANTTILGTMSILSASHKINDQIREKTNSKVVVESLDTKNLLNNEDVDKIQQNEHITFINRMAGCTAYPNNFLAVAGNKETDDGQVTLSGYDDMEKDSPFEEHICRLTEGDYAKNSEEVVINQNLADYNGLDIGAEITFLNAEGQTIRALITGFYLTGNERQQTESVATSNRIENQIYTTTELVCSMNQGTGFRKIAAYVDEPELLSKIAEELSGILMEKAEVGTIDTIYQKMKYSIIQIERITGLIFKLTVVTSIVVVGMLLCMWMRNRKTEIAVFISLGISKVAIFLQMLLETWMLFVMSGVLSTGAIALLIPHLAGLMSKIGNTELVMTFSIKNSMVLCGAGFLVLVLLVMIAMIPCFGKKIKDTLSEMEG